MGERRKLRKRDLLTVLYTVSITLLLLIKTGCDDDSFYNVIGTENNYYKISLKEVTHKIYDNIYATEKEEFLKQLQKFNKNGIIELDEEDYKKLLKKLKVNEGNKNKFYNDISDIINIQNEYTN